MPLPWTRSGPSFGFGAAGAHLPQPPWFGEVSVEAETGDRASTLSLYRAAIALRLRLQAVEALEWVDGGGAGVLHFIRPGGWHSVTNFAETPAALPAGEVLLASSPLGAPGELPGATTVWLR